MSLGASLVSFHGMKFLVVVIFEMFSGIIGFQKDHNAEKYDKLSSLKIYLHLFFFPLSYWFLVVRF